MGSQKFNGSVKKLVGLASALAAGVVVALPVLAQTNPSPSVFNEPPYSGSTSAQGETATPEAVPAPEAAPSPEALESPAPAPAPSPGALEPPAPAPMPEAMESPEAEAPTASESENTIVDVASSAGSFNTLTQALKAAGLDTVLQGEGPYTVFAPTDEAFAALPEGTLDELLKPENRDALVKVLSYHVVSGEVRSDELASGEVETVEGDAVTIAVDGETVKVNEATVTEPDVTASNGVIHVIDRVILPPDLEI